MSRLFFAWDFIELKLGEDAYTTAAAFIQAEGETHAQWAWEGTYNHYLRHTLSSAFFTDSQLLPLTERNERHEWIRLVERDQVRLGENNQWGRITSLGCSPVLMRPRMCAGPTFFEISAEAGFADEQIKRAEHRSLTLKMENNV